MVQPGDDLGVGDDGLTMPAAEVLTGRGFVTGKSGSGKSNTASVLAEELLALDARLLVVDTDGEYYGLKEEYELLHVGASERCDVVVGPSDAETIADLVVCEAVPVVVDISGFLEAEKADRLVYEVAKHVFAKAGEERQPCLLLVEEVHEFVPEQGGLDDVGEMIVRVAKRGRKRGLGLVGMSQRPAAVDKDFITQCDWLAWHRLTWANDTRVVSRVVGDEVATEVESLDAGEAFLQTDWDETTQRVTFRRKNTYDAGATPGFGETDEPDLTSVPTAWLAAFDGEERFDGEPAPDGESSGGDRSDAGDRSDDSETGSDGSGEVVVESRDGEPVELADATVVEPDDQVPDDVVAQRPERKRSRPSSSPPDDAHQATWELGQLVFYVCRSGVRRAAAGLRALGRRTRAAAVELRDEATESRGEAPTGAGGGRGAAGDDWPDADAGERSEHADRPLADLVVGGLIALAVAAAVVTLATVA